MTPAEDDRLEALTQAIARLQEQQADLAKRLWWIEQGLPTSRPAATVARPESEQQAPLPAQAAPVETLPPVHAPRPRLETRVGLTWINRVGAITLVFGVGFFFKYAIDNQWIGETGRVLLGILAGLVVLGAGEAVWRRDQKIFAQGISGTGVAILYLAVYAAYGFYHLAPVGPAFLAMALITALAGALALRYEAQAMAALGLFGGYATPLLLSTGQDQPWFFFSYLLLLNAAATAIARLRRWRGLEWLAFLATVLLFSHWYRTDFTEEKPIAATLFVLLSYALFATSGMRPFVLAAQIAVNVGIARLWIHGNAPYAVLTLALAAAGLAIADRRSWPIALQVTFWSFWISFVIWDGNHPLGVNIALVTGAFLLFLSWIPWRALIRKSAFTQMDFLLIPANGAAYFGIVYGLLHVEHHGYLGSIAAALAVAHVGLAMLLRDTESGEKWLCAGVGSAFLTLAIPIQFAGFRITMAWALEAAAIVWIGAKGRARGYIWTAAGVFFLVLFRLTVFDSEVYPSPQSYGTVFNLRFLTYVTVAVSFWLSARWVGERIFSLAAYTAGHVVLLAGLILEVLGWAGRTAARENLESVESASISVFMALYAVLLVTIGVATRTAINRIGGLALIAVVVAKLYLWDVWLLVRIYRVLAFAALGGLLLLTSYLYSRYRAAIENWWSDDKPEKPGTS